MIGFLKGVAGWIAGIVVKGAIKAINPIDKGLAWMITQLDVEWAVNHYLVERIRHFDDNVLDPRKKDFPETTDKVEKLFADALRKSALIVEDKA